jgi:hypothetical protein
VALPPWGSSTETYSVAGLGNTISPGNAWLASVARTRLKTEVLVAVPLGVTTVRKPFTLPVPLGITSVIVVGETTV